MRNLKFIITKICVLFFIISISLPSYSQVVKKKESILKNDITIVPSEGGYLIGFRDWTANKVGFVFNSNELIVYVEPIYDTFYNENFWKTDRIIVKKDGKWGAISCVLGELGDIKVPFIYDFMKPFKDGKALVTLNGKSFYIDTDGNRL